MKKYDTTLRGQKDSNKRRHRYLHLNSFFPIIYFRSLVDITVNWRKINREKNTEELDFTFGEEYLSEKFSLHRR